MTQLQPAQTLDQSIDMANFYQALNLVERGNLGAIPRKTTLDKATAKKLQTWKDQQPFNKENFFRQRLAADGLTEVEFQGLLAETVTELRSRVINPPAWLVALEEAYRPGAPQPAANLGDLVPEGYQYALALFEPLIRQGLTILESGLAGLGSAYKELPYDRATIVGLLFQSLPEQIARKVARTLALEVNIARELGRLQGSTGAERFADFMRQLQEADGGWQFLQEYPVLVRQVQQIIRNWAVNAVEFLDRLCRDWPLICRTFAAQTSDILVEVEGGAGDSHRNGHSVFKLKFASGFKLLYKPRSLALDHHFQDLLAWLSEHSALDFRPLEVLDLGDYGWTEFVHRQPCRDLAQVKKFYERQGGYLALLYALEATDFHCENLIAAGEYPVLIDLEALFHPRIDDPYTVEINDPAVNARTYSVIRVGLLPERYGQDDDFEGVDLSGLGGKPNQLSSQPVPVIQGIGTDEMRLVRERVRLADFQNRPTLNGEEVEVMDYLEDFKAGFELVYRVLLENREALMAGPLAAFANDPIRVIVRPTADYMKILQQSFHPNLLRDAMRRDRFFDRLWMAAEFQPRYTKVIPSERADLDGGDIPVFTTLLGTQAVYDSRGKVIENFLAEPGLLTVQKRLNQFSEADLERQLWFIQGSFTTVLMGAYLGNFKGSNLKPFSEEIPTPERLLKAARSVGDRLAKLAVRDGEAVNWIGLSLLNDRQWRLEAARYDLYNGTGGIILFMAYLGAVTGEDSYTGLARAGLMTLRRQLAHYRKHNLWDSLGGFEGLGAPIYLFTHLAQLWHDPALLDEAEKLVEFIPALVEQDVAFDWIGGAAGCINALLALYRLRPTQAILGVARQCGDHLLAKAQTMPHGLGWLKIQLGDQPLTGLAHGNAGIALSLLALAQVSGDRRYLETSRQALDYERHLFSTGRQNWPDLRQHRAKGEAAPAAEAEYMTAWCHGATGIGLARLGALQYLPEDERLLPEIEAAIITTVKEGFGQNHSLCHGDMDGLELLLAASQRFPGATYRELLEMQTGRVLDSLENSGPVSGIPLGVESPGLMVGLAGIGYQLLRLAAPASVPSVLLMAGPVPA